MSRYISIEENGQRIYGGPPPNWTGPAPPKGTRLFVSGLPKDCMEDEFIPVFEIAGVVYSTQISVDFMGLNRMFCFVKYASLAEKHKAIEVLSGYEIRPGFILAVSEPKDLCQLFLGNIPKMIDCEVIEANIRWNTKGVSNIKFFPAPWDQMMNRGFCFVTYDNHKSASDARKSLMINGIPEWSRVVLVDWAIPENKICYRANTIYIRNLGLRTEEETLRKALESLINPDDIVRIKKKNDFAYVQFTSRAATSQAIEQFDGFNLEGAKIEVMWAKTYHPNVHTKAFYEANLNAYDANQYLNDAYQNGYDANQNAYSANQNVYGTNGNVYGANQYAYDANQYAYNANQNAYMNNGYWQMVPVPVQPLQHPVWMYSGNWYPYLPPTPVVLAPVVYWSPWQMQ